MGFKKKGEVGKYIRTISFIVLKPITNIEEARIRNWEFCNICKKRHSRLRPALECLKLMRGKNEKESRTKKKKTLRRMDERYKTL